MKKYKYTQLLEISLELALAEIARLKDTKLPLIPDEDPLVSDFSVYRKLLLGGLGKHPEGWGKAEKTGHVLAELETTPDSVKATFIKEEDSHPSDAFWIKRKEGIITRKAIYPDLTSYEPNQETKDALDEIGNRPENLKRFDSLQDLYEDLDDLGLSEKKLESFASKTPHVLRPYTSERGKEIFAELLKGRPPLHKILEDLLVKLKITGTRLAEYLGVSRFTIRDWKQYPKRSVARPDKLGDLLKLYDEHFPKPKVEDPFTQGQQSVLSETSVGCIKVGEEIITEKPTPPLAVAPPKVLQRVPRLLQHTDSIELLQLPQRALNALQAVSIRTIGDLVQWTEEGLKNIKGLGDKSFKEVVNKTLKAGFRFTRLGK